MVAGVVVVVDGQTDLLEVVLALEARRRLTDSLHGWDQQRDQDRDNGDYDEQFKQGESLAPESLQQHGSLLSGKKTEGIRTVALGVETSLQHFFHPRRWAGWGRAAVDKDPDPSDGRSAHVFGPHHIVCGQRIGMRHQQVVGKQRMQGAQVKVLYTCVVHIAAETVQGKRTWRTLHSLFAHDLLMS